MKILLFEYLHVDEKMYAEASPSMRNEGRAMLQALCKDLSRISEVELSVALCVPAQRTVQISDADQIILTGNDPDRMISDLSKAAADFELVIPIAPECEGILGRLVHHLESSGNEVFAVNERTLQFCEDKWLTYQQLTSCNVATIPTALTPDVGWLSESQYVVKKPRDGAGCEGVQRLTHPQLYQASQTGALDAGNCILQPWIDGESFSMGIFIGHNRATPICLAPAVQNIHWEHDKPRYSGGQILSECPDTKVMQSLAIQAAEAVEFDRGYIGVDLLRLSNSEYYVTEINPRFTTSYIGYRKATAQNIALQMIRPSSGAHPHWNWSAVSFTADDQ